MPDPLTPPPAPAPAPHGRLLARTSLVAVGVGVSGVGTLAMLSGASHGSSARAFATIATWWLVATLLAFPFGVFETFLARQVVGAVATGGNVRGSVSATAGRALLLAGVAAVVCVVLDGTLSEKYFGGVHGMAALLGVFVVLGSLQSLQRGHAAGQARFDVVAAQLVTDGVGRALFVVVAVLLWPDHERVVALAICLGVALSLVVGHVRAPGWLVRPRLRDPAVRVLPVVTLLVGALGPILINTASVPWLSDRGAAALVIGAFSGALTLSRVPLQLGTAIFGPLLNSISHAVEDGSRHQLRSLSLRAGGAALGLGAVFVAGFTLLGPWVLRLFIGSDYTLPTWVFLCLASSTGLMLVAVVTQARIAAQERWNALAASWLLGAVVFVVVLALPGPTLVLAALSPLAAAVVALGSLVAVVVVDELRHPPTA